MRVTQSMLSNNMLRNLSSSYAQMGKLENQILTGKKVNRPSDDPVVAMRGIAYRTQVDKIAQFQRNLGEVNNWLDSSDDALDHVGEALNRAKDLMTNAPNGTLGQDDREKILSEIKEIRAHIQNLANTKIGDKYIFSGTNTNTRLHDGTNFSTANGINNTVQIEVFDDVMMTVNTNGKDMFESIDNLFGQIENSIEILQESSELSQYIEDIKGQMDIVLTERAVIGARQNRVEMMENRLAAQEGSAKKQMSENEDVDLEKAITEMITQESIHRAALSVGARIIQPSLVDFLR